MAMTYNFQFLPSMMLYRKTHGLQIETKSFSWYQFCHIDFLQAMQQPVRIQVSTQGSVLEAVSSAVQSIIGLAPANDQPLMECGLDSLGAVELRNSLATRFSLTDLPATMTFDHPSVNAIASFIAGMSFAQDG